MGKVIRFERPNGQGGGSGHACGHTSVEVFADTRLVLCSVCGAKLDPFEVLLEMVKAHVPEERWDPVERLEQETRRRQGLRDRESGSSDVDPSDED